jgi:hypothetical protein
MDFRKIVKSAGVTHAEASKKMFPNNANPYQAYTRLAAKEIALDEDQLRALSEITGYSVCQIIEMRSTGKQQVSHTSKKEVY